MPLGKNPVPAKARVAWIKEVGEQANKYLMGLNYEAIDPYQNNKIMRYAWMKKLFIPATLLIIIILGLGFAIGSFINVQLIKGNKALVSQLIKILQESSIAKQKVKEITKERQDLQLKIQALQIRIQTVEEERAKLEAAQADEIKKLNDLMDKFSQERSTLQEELIALQHKENTVTEELLRLDKRKTTLEKANLDKMYLWLKYIRIPAPVW